MTRNLPKSRLFLKEYKGKCLVKPAKTKMKVDPNRSGPKLFFLEMKPKSTAVVAAVGPILKPKPA